MNLNYRQLQRLWEQATDLPGTGSKLTDAIIREALEGAGTEGRGPRASAPQEAIVESLSILRDDIDQFIAAIKTSRERN